MTKHCDRISARRRIFVGEERPALVRRDTQHVEVVPGNTLAPYLLNLIFSSKVELSDSISGEAGEDFVAVAKFEITRVGSGFVRVVLWTGIDFDQLFRLPNGARPQEYGIDETEYR